MKYKTFDIYLLSSMVPVWPILQKKKALIKYSPDFRNFCKAAVFFLDNEEWEIQITCCSFKVMEEYELRVNVPETAPSLNSTLKSLTPPFNI